MFLSTACCVSLTGSGTDAGQGKLTDMMCKFEVASCVIVPNPDLQD